jgi:hypothetical protein
MKAAHTMGTPLRGIKTKKWGIKNNASEVI